MTNDSQGFEWFTDLTIKALVGDKVRLVYDVPNYKYHIKTVTRIDFMINTLNGNLVSYIDENGASFTHHEGVNHVERVED